MRDIFNKCFGNNEIVLIILNDEPKKDFVPLSNHIYIVNIDEVHYEYMVTRPSGHVSPVNSKSPVKQTKTVKPKKVDVDELEKSMTKMTLRSSTRNKK